MVQQVHQQGQSNVVSARNYTDDQGNPSGGYALGVGLSIVWQDGPRGKVGDVLQPANGAFVEDALVAARQRLVFFQSSKFRSDANANAIMAIDVAIDHLHARASERAARGVLGSNVV